jgi:hypothetical protein
MTSVLLLVDVQRNMLEPPTPVPAAAAVSTAIEDVLDRARAAGATVVHVRNDGGPGAPDARGTTGWELIQEVREGEHVVDKDEPDSFAGTPLADLIPTPADLVLVGMQSEYCIRATSLAGPHCTGGTGSRSCGERTRRTTTANRPRQSRGRSRTSSAPPAYRSSTAKRSPSPDGPDASPSTAAIRAVDGDSCVSRRPGAGPWRTARRSRHRTPAGPPGTGWW